MRKAADSKLEDPVIQLENEEVANGERSPLPAPHLRPGASITPRERVFVRTHGCRNCKHWNNGEMAERHFVTTNQFDAQALLERGRTLEEVDRILAAKKRLVGPPKTGVCLGNGAEASFTFPDYICTKFQNRLGVDAGRINDIPEELYAKLGEEK